MQVSLPRLARPPSPLWELYSGHHAASAHFLKHTRAYNCMLSMASIGMDRYHSLADLLPGCS